MNAVMQFLQTTFAPLVLIFTVSNLAAMGLQVRMTEVARALKNKKYLALIFIWGWILGPVLGLLITRILPLAEPFVIVVLLASLAPCAPFLQQMVGKARADIGFAGALIPLVAVGTVVLMPLMAPLLIKGLTISTWALAKPLLLTILLPLVIGAAIRHFSDQGATKIFPTVKKLAGLSTLLTIGWSWLVGPALPLFIRKARADMSLAAAIMPLAVVSTVVLMPLLAPVLIPGLTLSSWAIGKPLLLTVLLPLVVWLALSSFLGTRAGKTSAGGAAGLPVQ